MDLAPTCTLLCLTPVLRWRLWQQDINRACPPYVAPLFGGIICRTAANVPSVHYSPLLGFMGIDLSVRVQIIEQLHLTLKS